ncbi:MAG: hypothetical protein ACI8ZB_001414 [Desulforhopalus sp.]|jgi:hypothetical protein
MWYLKRLVAKRTLYLEREIQQRLFVEKTLEETNSNYVKA